MSNVRHFSITVKVTMELPETLTEIETLMTRDEIVSACQDQLVERAKRNLRFNAQEAVNETLSTLRPGLTASYKG